MKTLPPPRSWLVLAALAGAVGTAGAQTAAPAAAAPAAVAPAAAASAPVPRALLDAPAPPDRSEPNVRYTVIEDEGSKIDELRVRGQVEHVVVTPKVGLHKPYEIIVGRGGRQVANGTGGADSAIGKRVWNVLAF